MLAQPPHPRARQRADWSVQSGVSSGWWGSWGGLPHWNLFLRGVALSRRVHIRLAMHHRTVMCCAVQMESVEGIFLSLFDLSLLTLPTQPTHCASADAVASGTFACRQGGVCQADGSCLCPSSSSPSCTGVACGYGGLTCAQPICVAAIEGERRSNMHARGQYACTACANT